MKIESKTCPQTPEEKDDVTVFILEKTACCGHRPCMALPSCPLTVLSKVTPVTYREVHISDYTFRKTQNRTKEYRKTVLTFLVCMHKYQGCQ